MLAPCALGGAINPSNIALLRCKVICGSANNQLSHDGLADDLAALGILYAPDFVANAGGLINIGSSSSGYDRDKALHRAEGIGPKMDELLTRADQAGTTPLAAAYELARERLLATPGRKRAAERTAA